MTCPPNLLALVEEARKALIRLGSMEGFRGSRLPQNGQDDELLARIDYARNAVLDLDRNQALIPPQAQDERIIAREAREDERLFPKPTGNHTLTIVEKGAYEKDLQVSVIVHDGLVGAWIVETVDEIGDGTIHQTWFLRPDAERRANEYAIGLRHSRALLNREGRGS